MQTCRDRWKTLSLLPVLLATALVGAEASHVSIHDGDRVAFLGDSITAGGANYGGYCRLVVHGLKVVGIRVQPVLAGVPGNTSKDMLERLEQDVLRFKPNWVVLAAGVNDIWHGDPTVKIGVFQPKPGMGVKLDDYKQNVIEIIRRCEAAGARTILTTITPIREDPAFKLNLIAREYNAFLLQLARERSLPIAKLNEEMFAEIAKGVRLTSDGVHPIEPGHRAMASGLLRAMGVSDEDIARAEDEWQKAPRMLILGDRQTTSGGRTGGWCHLLMDGMNDGREMMTYATIADYKKQVTVNGLLSEFRAHDKGRVRYVLLQAPRGDVEQGTPLADYRTQIDDWITAVNDSKARPVLITMPVLDQDASSDRSVKLAPYNEVLRAVAKAHEVPLADIYGAMAERYRDHPGEPLTFDGERFNHQGAILMAEAIMRAMGMDSMITPALRKTWTERPYYAKSEDEVSKPTSLKE